MIDYLDLKRVTESFEPELSSVIRRVTESGWYIRGKECEKFEEILKRFAERRFVLALQMDWKR